MNLAAFPRRPLDISDRLPTRRGILLLVFGGIFFAGCFLVFALSLGPGIFEDMELAKEGSRALNGQVSGELSSRLFTTWGNLKLEYTVRGKDGDMTSFERNKDIFFAGNLDDSKEPVIYYLKSNPRVATVSYALDLLLNRQITLGVALLVELALVWAAIWGCIRTMKLRRRLRLAADHPEPIEVTITALHVARGRKYINYAWENGKRRRAAVVWKKATEPLFTSPNRDRALAVKGPDGYAHLLDTEFQPFVLTEEEKAALGPRSLA